jgi:hypothetical protein
MTNRPTLRNMAEIAAQTAEGIIIPLHSGNFSNFRRKLHESRNVRSPKMLDISAKFAELWTASHAAPNRAYAQSSPFSAIPPQP